MYLNFGDKVALDESGTCQRSSVDIQSDVRRIAQPLLSFFILFYRAWPEDPHRLVFVGMNGAFLIYRQLKLPDNQ